MEKEKITVVEYVVGCTCYGQPEVVRHYLVDEPIKEEK